MAEGKKPLFKNIWFYLAVIIAIVIIILISSGSSSSEYDTFAKCLSEEGATMYGTEWCSHCKNQKEMFGSSFDKINFVNCDFQEEACLRALVTGYPTWKVDGQNYPGLQSLERLSELTGCELVKDI